MSEELQISFVIPVYNAEMFIRETVERIINSPNPDGISYEVICVNDRSTDQSGAILDEMEKEFPSVRAVHREKNGHVAAARNTGINEAKGKWICLIDSDDLVNQNLFKVMARTIEDDCDIIYYGYDQFIESPKPDAPAEPLPPTYYFDEKAVRIQQLELISRRKMKGRTYGYRTLGLIWAKLYRRNFLNENNIRSVENMRYEEDLSFNVKALAKCKKAKQINWPFLHYRLVPVSFSHGYVHGFWDRIAETVPIYRDILSNFYPGDKEMENLLPYRILWELLFAVLRGPAHHASPDSMKEKRKLFNDLVNSPLYKDIFNQVNIMELDLSNAVLAFCVKKHWLLACILLERILQLKNKILN